MIQNYQQIPPEWRNANIWRMNAYFDRTINKGLDEWERRQAKELCLMDLYEIDVRKPKPKKIHKKGGHIPRKAVLGDGGSRWKSLRIAAADLGVTPYAVTKAIRQRMLCRGRKLWIEGTPEPVEMRVPRGRRAVLSDRGERWENTDVAATALGVRGRATVSACIHSNVRCKGRVLWYEGSPRPTLKPDKRIPVKSDRGEWWPSMRAAAIALDVMPETIYHAVRRGWPVKTACGRRFYKARKVLTPAPAA